ncbi:uncharacterized protein KIAA1522 homolog isoform X2 [Xyrauchen texanus]|uniref:uncharacterized protein KIAA1522 homolog isoform X2 n=1 Tax=Xyrauchen texanus TaxID=154827 RepID=UPI002241D0ED|nr:uncharacterized protein KIAA1522 homolog isoform X2 [Xyrauchen texanus]
MSRSSSVGDLVPKDITEILALQTSKKKRGSSLSRVFSWFKGSKRKRSVSNMQSRTGGLCGRTGESATSNQIHASKETFKGQKQDEQSKLTVHYTPSQHYQENVFIEGSRPQYLEDLHTEAQEGLKILQQEEHKNGVDFQDDQTVPEEDESSKERHDSLETDNTPGHYIISVSTVSAVSARPVLTRQGSTFKPLDPVKRLDKTRRRSRRTTIMGIPQQVQRELDMTRGTILQQLPNGKHDCEDDSSGSVVIPTFDGDFPSVNHEGARVHLQNIEVLQTSLDEELLRQHIQSVYDNDLSLNRRFGPGMCNVQRPKSLAVPGMTTHSFLQELHGPVMSISPQATYLSKIIPNAIMPAAIDVIEINRGHNRRSLCRVSKSSLASASPASSRSRGGTNAGLPTNSPNRSHSQSSETIVSNSSTISSKGRGPPICVADSTKEVSDLNPKDVNVASSNSWISSDGTCTRLQHGDLSDEGENVRNINLFSQSLSVMKTKLPPAPPQRTYSLHHEKLKQRSRECVDIKDFNDMAKNDGQMGKNLSSPKEGNQSTNKEKSSVHSSVPRSSKDFQLSVKSSTQSPDPALTGSLAESNNSSPQKIATAENKFDRTLSPSSGYSSQSGTPSHSPKEVSPSSPERRRVQPSKPERAGVRTSPVVSISSSITSLSSVTSDTGHQDTQTTTTSSESLKLTPLVTIVQNKVTPTPPTVILRELFNIPSPPKVKAPSPPPPETWIHNKRTFELLCGPGPNPYRLHQLQKQQKEPLTCTNKKTDIVPNNDQMITEKQTPDIDRKTGTENKRNVLEKQNESVLPQGQKEIMAERPALRYNESSMLQRNEQVSPHVRENNQIIQIDDRNVENRSKKGSQPFPKRELPTIQVDQSMLSETYCEKVNRGAELVSTTSIPKSDETDAENQRNCIVQDISNHKPMQMLDIEVPKVNGISPSPSPPPEHHPPPPPTKISSASSVSISPAHEVEHRQVTEEAPSLESSWPPPPPPMDSADSMFEEPYELDFPPPPPSFIHEPLSEISHDCHEEFCEQQASTELVSSNANDMVISVQKRSEIDTILTTITVNNYTDMEDRQHDNPQCCNNVSDFSMDHVHMENTNVVPPKMSTLSLDTQANSTNVPLAPHLSLEDKATVNFKRQQNIVTKDNRSKELLFRHKSTPIPKEDANIPLVTSSLLQMVRLRSVNVGEDQVNNDSLEATTNDDQNISNQAAPQKPIRRSLTLKSNPPTKSPSATGTVPSLRLQEAIRMKTAAMCSSGVPAMLNLRLSSTTSVSSPVPSPKTPESCDLHNSPASTASFIFSKSTKVVIETPTSPEAQASHQQNLAAEIIQVSNQAKMMITNGTRKSIKVPPPVAKKPAHATNPANKTVNRTTDKTESLTNEQRVKVEVNGQSNTVHPAGQHAQASGTQDRARRTETAC